MVNQVSAPFDQTPPNQTGYDDDSLVRVQTLVAKWGRTMVVAAIVIIAIVYGFYSYNDAQISKRRLAADTFSQLQEGVKTIEKLVKERNLAEVQVAGLPALKAGEAGEAEKAVKTRDEAVKKLEEVKSSLKTAHDAALQKVSTLAESTPPYQSLALVYATTLSRLELGGDGKAYAPPAVSGQPSRVEDLSSWKSVPASFESERIKRELWALASAKSKLDQPEQFATAKTELTDLAKEGTVVQVSAVLALATVAAPEEADEIKKLLKTIREKFPEQGTLLDPEISRLDEAS